jgi:hypothetical protein
VRFLKPGAFDAQNPVTVSEAKLLKRLGRLAPKDFDDVIAAVLAWYGLNIRP